MTSISPNNLCLMFLYVIIITMLFLNLQFMFNALTAFNVCAAGQLALSACGPQRTLQPASCVCERGEPRTCSRDTASSEQAKKKTVTDFGWSQHPRFHCFVSSVQRSTRFWIQAILHITERNMVKYFCNSTDIRSAWDHVVSAFWQRYPNPFSTHVLTEDVVYREVTADHRLLSRRLLMKTNRLPRWAERLFPSGMSRCVYIIEDSIVDPVNRSLTTYTWNLNHTTLMSVEERCVFQDSAEQPATTQLRREAVDILERLRLLQTYSGVWIGPLQEQPGEGHERAGIRAVQLTGRDAPAAAQGHSEGCFREGQGGGKEPGFSCCRPTETTAIRVNETGARRAAQKAQDGNIAVSQRGPLINGGGGGGGGGTGRRTGGIKRVGSAWTGCNNDDNDSNSGGFSTCHGGLALKFSVKVLGRQALKTARD
ncbi:PRELI domain-containing protein 1, mitochondrial [Larimichthys crocea]|uniref:Uncharacterized protein n=1 Tax=Larimichthys crocea TaxID=215358 RepID=A0ACD3RVM4_LARCR|nr:PRELI domain-containing protein 1, mitochondrial [Larimichthys crocea]